MIVGLVEVMKILFCFLKGIFCVNYMIPSVYWKACLWKWCTRYNKVSKYEEYRVVCQQEQVGFEINLEENEEIHMVTRSKDD